jgi:hypothetical protein
MATTHGHRLVGRAVGVHHDARDVFTRAVQRPVPRLNSFTLAHYIRRRRQEKGETDSRRSRAMYSPPASLTKFFLRSMTESVPSLFHCAMSPVMNQPSSVKASLVKSSRLSAGSEMW